jgi:hypothetical protein
MVIVSIGCAEINKLVTVMLINRFHIEFFPEKKKKGISQDVM